VATWRERLDGRPRSRRVGLHRAVLRRDRGRWRRLLDRDAHRLGLGRRRDVPGLRPAARRRLGERRSVPRRWLDRGRRLLVGGDGGAAMTSADDGQTWTALQTGTTENLYAVAFADAQHGVAVGRRGTVIVTADGGATWTARPLGRDIYLGAAAIDATTITIAG